MADRRSAAIRHIVGKTITLSGRGYDVVGVMPRDFFFPGPRRPALDAVRLHADACSSRSRRPHWLGVVARLKPGVSLEQAREDMDRHRTRSSSSNTPTPTRRWACRLEPLHDSFASEPRPALLMLSGAVGLLFLIVCANIANLQLGRAAVADARAGDPPRARRRPRRGCCASC